MSGDGHRKGEVWLEEVRLAGKQEASDSGVYPLSEQLWPLYEGENINKLGLSSHVYKQWSSVYFANISTTKHWIFKSFFFLKTEIQT